MKETLAIVLGGGAGSRLDPLTRARSKPAVPLAGKYRIVDVAVSNCLHAGVNRAFVLTQYNSASLNHHVTDTYRFSIFSRGFVNILAAEQAPDGPRWFEGTADAVRKVLHHLEEHAFDQLLVLSDDQLYKLDLARLLAVHRESGAALTVAVTAVTAAEAPGFGILHADGGGRIVRFVEKPPLDRLAGLESDTGDECRAAGRHYMASMGIYVFERPALFDLLTRQHELMDFGRHVLPHAVANLKVQSFRHDGYWADIGTIGSFFAANLDLVGPAPRFRLDDEEQPIYTRARMLPPTRIAGARVRSSLVTDGAYLEDCEIADSVIGLRSVVRAGAKLRQVVLMGADFQETAADREHNRTLGRPDVGIGAGSRLVRAIVDKNARIGRGVVLEGAEGRPDEEAPTHVIRDGIVVVPKGAVVPDGTHVPAP